MCQSGTWLFTWIDSKQDELSSHQSILQCSGTHKTNPSSWGYWLSLSLPWYHNWSLLTRWLALRNMIKTQKKRPNQPHFSQKALLQDFFILLNDLTRFFSAWIPMHSRWLILEKDSINSIQLIIWKTYTIFFCFEKFLAHYRGAGTYGDMGTCPHHILEKTPLECSIFECKALKMSYF